MNIFIEKEQKEQTLTFNGTVKQLLDHIKINSEEVLVVKDSELLTEDDVLKDSDSVRILSVISGG